MLLNACSRTAFQRQTLHAMALLLIPALMSITISPAVAQSVGETIICKPTGSESDWRQGVVTENNPSYNFIRVKCGPAKNGNPGGIFLVDRKDVRKLGEPQAREKLAGADAQNRNGALAVGQSVVCLPTGTERDVRTGKIIENNPSYNFVRVECPPGANGLPGGIFLVARTDIRSPNTVSGAAPTSAPPATLPPTGAGVAAHAGATAQPASPANNTATRTPAGTQQAAAGANKAKCACPAQTQANGNSIEDNIKRTIIARYVRNGGALDAGHTPSTVHFDSFQIIGRRPYRMPVPGAYYTGSPDGPGGKMGTQVYEVLCKYTVCIDYPGYQPTGYRGRLHIVDHDAGYTCFIDAQGSWRCNQSKDRMTTRDVDK